MKLKYIFLIAILLCSALVATSTPADIYRPIHPSDNSLSGLVFATGDVSKMDYWFEDGSLYVDSSVHDTMSFRLNKNMLSARLKGWNGNTVRLSHRTDAGVVDSSEVINVQSDGTWIYFYDVDFSTVIVDGYAGTTTKIDTTISNNMTNFSYGQSFTNMTSVTVNVTQGYDSALSKYAYIESLNPVLWLKADGNANDSSVYGNNGIFYDDANVTSEIKYNESFGLDGDGDYINVGNNNSLNFSTNNFSIFVTISTFASGDIIAKRDGSNEGFEFSILSDVFSIKMKDTNEFFTSNLNSNIIVNDGNVHTCLITIDRTNGLVIFYIDNNFDVSHSITGLTTSINTSTDMLIGYKDTYYNGIVDNVLIFNRTLTETERNNLYYDPVQKLRVRTNSNATWSDNWNSTADNSMDVNFGSGEVLTHLIKYMPTTATVDGVITRDYNTTAQFSMSSTVGFTEATTVISEAAASNYYTLNISHQAGLNSSGYINYTTTNADLLAAEWNGTVNFDTDNQNATLIYIEPTFYISTGVLNSGDTWQYNVTVPYGDMPNYDIHFSDYDFESLGTVVNITLSNYTFGLTKVGFNFSENIDGMTYYWRYRTNYSEIMNLTASSHNETLEFMPDYLVPEGESYISRGEAPIITDWSNNITLNTSQDITINITESIEFNATADQTVSTWNWFKDDVDAANNLYNYIVSWLTGGSKTIAVNVTNENGTSNTITWNITVNIKPPQNLESTVDSDHIHFDWNDYSSADYWNISQMTQNVYVTTDIIVLDGIKDNAYSDYGHTWVGDSPNPTTLYGKEEITWVRNATILSGYADGEDNDNKNNDDTFELMLDFNNDNLTTIDLKYKLNEGGTVTATKWTGSAWNPESTNAVGVVVGGGVAGAIQYEMQIPISELTNFSNENTFKFAMRRTCTNLNPDVESYYPQTLINDSDATLWTEMTLRSETQYKYLGNTTNSEYISTGLDNFTWYKHKFTTINGTEESIAVYSSDTTNPLAHYNISGTIFHSNGSVFPNATVYSVNGFIGEATTTDENGAYSGENFHNGSYTIYANATGYFLNSTSITINGTDLTNINLTLIQQTTTLTIPANSWSIFNNWSEQISFSEIADKTSNDVVYSHYNATTGYWESYYVGYSWNSGYTVNTNDSIMVYVNAETSITSSIITPSSTDLTEGWNMIALQGTSNQTISSIKSNIGLNCTDIWAFNSSAGAYTNLSTYTLQPNQGFLADIGNTTTWTRVIL